MNIIWRRRRVTYSLIGIGFSLALGIFFLVEGGWIVALALLIGIIVQIKLGPRW